MTFRLISCDGNRVEDGDEAGRAPYISLRAGRRGAAAEVTLRSAGSVMSRRATPHTHTLFIYSQLRHVGDTRGCSRGPGSKAAAGRGRAAGLRQPFCENLWKPPSVGPVTRGTREASSPVGVPGRPRRCQGVCGVPGESAGCPGSLMTAEA